MSNLMEEDEKLKEILDNGGSIIMHKNDLERLKEAARHSNKPNLYDGVKVYADQLGVVQEGKPLAVIIDHEGHEFDFRNSFVSQ